ncbi:saccharopine dehydrogenase NADP-binding domain-containing protein [Candidatus Woesearchaeota archaeon]|nr:saccharopine dehydrogenase NADP-binding domain-containing protein [Candidatus Woesearchaeota archaeon]
MNGFPNPKIVIAGAGGIGSAVGLILREIGDVAPATIYIGDMDVATARNAAMFIADGSSKKGDVEPFELPKHGTSDGLERVVKDSHLLLDCLPGSEAPRMAELALRHGLSYANLTEYVDETNRIISMADGTESGLILQTGLAPGFINVLAMRLLREFTERYGSEAKIDYVAMKVGALSQHAGPPSYYAFTWSPIGVATEYIEPAIVIRDGKKTTVDSLSERGFAVINGRRYEEDLTSGGAADLPDHLAGRVNRLDYKTLRHEGHYTWIDGLLQQISQDSNDHKAQKLQPLMEQYVPSVEEDFVVIYASVTGSEPTQNGNGQLRTVERAYVIEPSQIGSRQLRAIQSTTAASLAESARLLFNKKPKGVLLQSQIDGQQFLNGPYVSAVYGKTTFNR